MPMNSKRGQECTEICYERRGSVPESPAIRPHSPGPRCELDAHQLLRRAFPQCALLTRRSTPRLSTRDHEIVLENKPTKNILFLVYPHFWLLLRGTRPLFRVISTHRYRPPGVASHVSVGHNRARVHHIVMYVWMGARNGHTHIALLWMGINR